MEDLEDLTRARVLIETMALRESINDDDLAWESNVLSAHHAPGNLDSTREATLTAKGRKRPKLSTTPCYRVPTADDLKSIATELGDCWQLHRHWSGELAHDKDRNVAAEHPAIAELTLKRDAEEGTQALAEHIDR